MLKRFVSAVLCVMMALTTTVVYYSGSESYSVEAAVDYETPYYYNQLSANGKKFYKTLKAAILKCQSEFKMDDMDMDDEDIQKIVELLILHDPTTFNLSDLGGYATTDRRSKKSVLTFELDYTYNKATYNKMVEAYEKKTDDILAKLTDDMSTYKKIRTIHDEIIKNTVYDLESPTNATVYGTLVKKKAKCDGYAKTFSYICSKAGIRTVTVIGNASRDGSTEKHMWNKVYYNKKWYNVDVTWDDPVSNLKNNMTHDYFMISDGAIKKSHTEDNLSFEVPKASDNSISYYKVNNKYADSLDSAKSLISSGITSAAKNNNTYYEFQCSSKSVYNQVRKYVDGTGNITNVLKTAKKNSGKKLATGIYSSAYNDDQYTIRIMIFYEGTTLDKYYNDTSELDSNTIKAFAKYGVK